MAEALAKVKQQFGREAVIISTRTTARGGLLGVGSRRCVEITAAPHPRDLPRALRPAGLSAAPPVRLRGEAAAAMSPAALQPPAASPTASVQADTLLAEVGTLKGLVSDLVRETRRSRAPQLPEPLYDSYLQLVQNDVAEDLAQEVIRRVRDELTPRQMKNAKAVRGALAQAIQSLVPVAGPISLSRAGGPTVIALVGPTGVGKTTTIAKLAANLRLREKRRVGLITIDTYRIGAVEQLRTYAQIIDVPIAVVMTPRQLKEAVAGMSDREVILIDTAGRGQRDAAKLGELQAYFSAVRPNEVHLVLSSTGRPPILHETIEKFAAVGVDRVIFTKLDEAVGFGVVLACLKKANAALSYVTTGQDVPDDLEVGESRRLADLIVGNENVECRMSNEV